MGTFSNCFTSQSIEKIATSLKVGFLPSVIYNSDVITTDTVIFNDTNKQFKITSIDWVTKTIVIKDSNNKGIWLPRFNKTYNGAVNGTWQVYLCVANNLYPYYTLQLTEQVSTTTFKFVVGKLQDTTTMETNWVVGERVGFRNSYITFTPYLDSNKEHTIDNTTDESGVCIIDNDDTGRGMIIVIGHNFEVGEYVCINDIAGNGNGVFSIHSIDSDILTLDNINTGSGIDKDNLYCDNTSYIYKSVKPLQLDATDFNGLNISNKLVTALCYNNKYISLSNLNTGGMNATNYIGISTSINFNEWSNIKLLNPPMTAPTWGQLRNGVLLPRNSNIIINNIWYLPLQCYKAADNTYTKIGLVKINITDTDNLTYTYSTDYIKPSDMTHDSVTYYRCSQFYKFNNTTYVILEVRDDTVGDNAGVYRTRIYTSDNLTTANSSLSNLNLTFIQELSRNSTSGMDYAWNGRILDGGGSCEMFSYQNKLYILQLGATTGEAGLTGNRSNTIGLYEFNTNTGLFEEFYCNPVFMCPFQQGYNDLIKDHYGLLTVITGQNGDLKALISGHSGGIDTYTIFNAILHPATQIEIDEFKTNNNLT